MKIFFFFCFDFVAIYQLNKKRTTTTTTAANINRLLSTDTNFYQPLTMDLAHISFASVAKYLFPTTVNGDYAALTSGLSVFLVLIFLLSFFFDINDAIALDPKALFYFNRMLFFAALKLFWLSISSTNAVFLVGKLSNYPLGHTSLLHLILNVVALYHPLANFELKHGTVYTGIVLNILAMATAIPFCFVGIVFFRNTHVIGASGWVFSFAAYFAHKESKTNAVYKINSNFAVPTLYLPVIFLFVTAILVPNSSFWGHLFGLLAGYLLAFGYLDKFISPPTKKVVPFIESKLNFLISRIPSKFYYLTEEAAVTLRQGYSSIIPLTETGANKRQSMPPPPNALASQAPPGFQGPGHTLNE